MPKIIPQGPEGTIWFGQPGRSSPLLARCGRLSTRLACPEPWAASPRGASERARLSSLRLVSRSGLPAPGRGSLIIRWLGMSQSARQSLLLRTLPTDQSVWTSLTSRFTVDLICAVTVRCVNRGFELPPEVLGSVAERGITLSFDIFCQVDPRNTEALEVAETSASSAPADGPSLSS